MALLVGSMHAPPTFAATPVSIIGIVDNTDAIASCSLRIDPDSKMVTPLVTMQPPPRTSAVDIRFTFFDFSGNQVGTQDVSVPPPSFGPVLSSFPLPGQIASAHCNLKPPDTPSSSPSPGASGGGGGGGGGGAGIAIVGGVVAVGAVVALAAGHGGGGGSPSSAPITATPTTPTPFHPTPTPTPTTVRTPTPVPTRTPVATPTPVKSASPMPTVSPVQSTTPTPVASPSATPAAGTVVLMPSSLSFTSTGSAYNQTSTASETGYTGTFSSTASSCGGIATIAASGATFTVTPQGAGTCAFTISDTHNDSAQLSITVTVANGVIEGRRKSMPAPAPAPKPHS